MFLFFNSFILDHDCVYTRMYLYMIMDDKLTARCIVSWVRNPQRASSTPAWQVFIIFLNVIHIVSVLLVIPLGLLKVSNILFLLTHSRIRSDLYCFIMQSPPCDLQHRFFYWCIVDNILLYGILSACLSCFYFLLASWHYETRFPSLLASLFCTNPDQTCLSMMQFLSRINRRIVSILIQGGTLRNMKPNNKNACILQSVIKIMQALCKFENSELPDHVISKYLLLISRRFQCLKTACRIWYYKVCNIRGELRKLFTTI